MFNKLQIIVSEGLATNINTYKTKLLNKNICLTSEGLALHPICLGSDVEGPTKSLTYKGLWRWKLYSCINGFHFQHQWAFYILKTSSLPVGRTNCGLIVWPSQHLSELWTYLNHSIQGNTCLNINYLSPKLLGFCLLNMKSKNYLPLPICMWKRQQMNLLAHLQAQVNSIGKRLKSCVYPACDRFRNKGRHVS